MKTEETFQLIERSYADRYCRSLLYFRLCCGVGVGRGSLTVPVWRHFLFMIACAGRQTDQVQDGNKFVADR